MQFLTSSIPFLRRYRRKRSHRNYVFSYRGKEKIFFSQKIQKKITTPKLLIMPQVKTFDELRIEAIVKVVASSITDFNQIDLSVLSYKDEETFSKAMNKLKEIQ